VNGITIEYQLVPTNPDLCVTEFASRSPFKAVNKLTWDDTHAIGDAQYASRCSFVPRLTASFAGDATHAGSGLRGTSRWWRNQQR
jgi:hypothetical protein